MNVREYASKYIKDYNSRILEFGPLTRCLLDRKKYKNYFFADIRSTEEVKKLYSGNEYLKRTGIEVNTDDVIDIDFVVKGSYKDTFINIKKFDYVIVSHVLEHIPNLLDFFLDIKNILNKEGEIIILYPDRRFCFDHFRSDSKFSDIYDVWKNGINGICRQSLDFFTNVIPENNPVKFWNLDEKINMDNGKNAKKNVSIYLQGKKGEMGDDVHYWPFSDYAFLKFLRDCRIYDLFSFFIKRFVPTQKNTQEFLVIMKLIQFNGFRDVDKAMLSAKNNYENEYFKISEYDKLKLQNDRLNSEIGVVKENLKLKEKELLEKTRVRNMIILIVKKFAKLVKKTIYRN